YDGYNGDFTKNTAFVPTNLSHWIYEGTGFVAGDSVPGIVGYEYDKSNNGFPLPANQSYDVISSSPFVDNNNDTVLANAAVYQAPGGAWVFATGTLSWSWGLARDGLADVRIERMTENFLDRAVTPDAPIAADLQPGSDTGPSDSDDETDDTTPSFDVQCSLPGNSITLVSDNPAADTIVGSHVCAGAGIETLEVSAPIALGVHNLTLTETDTIGNESPVSPILTVTVTEPPPALVPAGAVLALEADSGVVTNTAGTVLSWADQSASGNNLTARSGDPMVGTAPSGAPAIVFDGVTDRLRKIGGLSNMPNASADRTVFVVAENREAGWGGFGWGVRGNNRTFGVGTAPTGNYAVQGWANANSFDSGVAAVGQGWAIQSVTLESDQLTHLVDGVVVDSQTHTFNTANNLIVVGSEIDGAPQLDMSVAAIYVYDRVLSPLEQTQLANFLTDKYLTVGPDETAPIIETGQSFEVEVDAADSAAVGTVLASDNEAVTGFAITDGDPTGVFAIDSAGQLTVADSALLVEDDVYTLSIEASDAAGNTATESVTVTVVPSSPIPAGAVLVLEADSGVVTNTAGTVLSWADQSSSGNDLTARSGDPKIGVSPSGAPVLEFDGVTDRLRKVGGLSDMPNGSADRSVIVVAENREAGWGGFGWGVRGNNRTFGVGTAPTGNYAVQGWAAANSFDSGVPAVGQGWAIQSVTLESDQLTHLVDGVVVDSQTHTFNTANNLIVVGSEIDGAPQLDMSVAAIYVFDRKLGDTERAELETYLYDKYLNMGPDVTAPVIEPGQAFTVDTDAVDGDELGVVAASDDVGVTGFQIVDGDQASVFAIDAAGSLTVADAAALVDGEQYILTIQASDAIPNSSTETVVVDVVAPSPIPDGVVLALEADTGVVTNTAGTVLNWADQSPSANNLTARSGNPTVAASPSGAPVIAFDGVSDQLRRTSNVNDLPTGSADRTVFVVVEHREAGWGGFGWGRRALNQTFGVGTAPSGNYAIQGFGTANSFDSGVAAVGSGWAVQSATLEADELTHFVDGVQVDSQTHTFNTASNLIVLGAEIDSNPQLDMSVGAVYVFDRALTAPELQQMNAYLSGKYLGP
ncbi:MAG: N,N-dimethylformamidase beta subunit family domain-containing protein, partial [Acidimicrobiales bacterium]